MKVVFLNPWTNEEIKEFKLDKLEDFYKEVSKEIFLNLLIQGEYKIKVDYDGIFNKN